MPRRNSLYIRHLPDSCRHEDLRRAFGRYGRIVDITIPLDFKTRRMKGYAFLEFEDPRDAEDAHYNMDHTRFMGREIEVEFTRGYRKTPAEMRQKDKRDDNHRSSGGGGRRYRSRSRSRSRSASRGKRAEPYYRSRSNDRREEPRGRNSNAKAGRSVSRSRSRSRSGTHEGVNGTSSRKSNRRRGRRDDYAASKSPQGRRHNSRSRSLSGSY